MRPLTVQPRGGPGGRAAPAPPGARRRRRRRRCWLRRCCGAALLLRCLVRAAGAGSPAARAFSGLGPRARLLGQSCAEGGLGKRLRPGSRRLPRRTLEVLSSQYELDEGASLANPARRPARQDGLVFDKEKVWDFVCARPVEFTLRLFYLITVAVGIWWAWQSEGEPEAKERTGKYNAASMRREGPSSRRGEALRAGLAEMGCFFVKCGQTLAQRPDLVGDEIAEELKGLQERNAPFDDSLALQIIAEDLRHSGPLAPGVLPPGCDPSGAPLLKELNPKHIASASLGQVYRGRLHDGREVALKVQRPGIRESIGYDWAAAVLVCQAYCKLKNSINDYSLIVDTVAKGVQMEVDYHNEAANADEFAMRHTFLPFVSSPGWIPEYTGPEGTARVLCLNWYPSRAPSELSREERRCLVEMAVEACVVQLLVTGFVHADPHEGNLRWGDDGRLVFLDFGLMDRVDFGVMEVFAAGIRTVLNKDWLELARCMQEARFVPTPTIKLTAQGAQACPVEEFAEALGEQMQSFEGGTTRFGAMAMALKGMSNRYAMLTPPYVALLCRTFITLEGLLGDDPQLAKEFNIYEAALPFAVRRVLSPRTRKGQAALREALLRLEPGAEPMPNWDTLAAFLNESEGGDSPPAAGVPGVDHTSRRSEDPFGATEGVQRRLLRTSEGAALRRILYDVDLFQALHHFLLSKDTRPLRRKAVDLLAAQMATWRLKPRAEKKLSWGPRCSAAAAAWGEWSPTDPYRLPSAALKTSKKAWRLVLRRQLTRLLWPPWRLPYRVTVGAGCMLYAAAAIYLQAWLREMKRRRAERRQALAQ